MPPTVTPFRGVTDIADRLSTIHPQDWASEIYRYMPLGKKKGMLSLHTEALGNGTTESQVFNWWDKAFNQRSGAVLDVYDGPGLTNATSTGSTLGQIKNVAMTAANAKLWEDGDQLQLTSTLLSAYTSIVGRVVGKTIAGDATSYVTIKLMAADSNNVLASSAIRFNPAGQSFPNSTELPTGRFYEVRQRTNYAANYLGAYQMTVHEIKEKSRVNPNAWSEATIDAMQDLNISVELGNIFSQQDSTDPRNYATGGLDWWLTPGNGGTVAGRNQISFKNDSTYFANSETGTFPVLGYQWLRNIGEYLARWTGGGTWNVYCGGLAMEAINAMVADRGYYKLDTGVDDFGFNYSTLHMMNGDWKFYQHPLFANEPAYQRTMVVVRPELIKTRVFLPLRYVPPQEFESVSNSGSTSPVRLDGNHWSTVQKAGWFVSQGIEVNNPDTHAIITGVGLDVVRS